MTKLAALLFAFWIGPADGPVPVTFHAHTNDPFTGDYYPQGGIAIDVLETGSALVTRWPDGTATVDPGAFGVLHFTVHWPKHLGGCSRDYWWYVSPVLNEWFIQPECPTAPQDAPGRSTVLE